MLNENLKTLRKERCISQENLAMQLNVVRQTVSKWEAGTSVPDAEMLIKIADVLGVNVSDLLGTPIENESNPNLIAMELVQINEQLAIKNNRSRRIWKTIGILCVLLFAIIVLTVLLATRL